MDRYGGWDNFGFCLNDIRQKNTSYEEMSVMIREQINNLIKDEFLTTGGK